jgi:zinc protease
MLVVVGNVSRQTIEGALRRTLGKLPLGNYKWTLPTNALTQTANPSNVVIARRSLPTNYILGYYPGPLASSDDYYALRIATTVLTERMFEEIRSKQNLTYDVHAPYLDRALTSGGLYVTTVAPNRVLQIMRGLVDELQNNTMSELWMDFMVRHFIVTYLLDNETNGAQANFLARAELYQGDYREGLGEQFVSAMKRVKPQDVQRVARQYMRNMKFAYVGDPGVLDQKLLERFR